MEKIVNWLWGRQRDELNYLNHRGHRDVRPRCTVEGIRGGHVYPELVKQSAKKPLRVYIQDGVNDNLGLNNPERWRPPCHRFATKSVTSIKNLVN